MKTQHNNAPVDTVNYKDTIFLPQTDFPLRANAEEMESQVQSFWDDMELDDWLTQRFSKRKPFVLHDGPVYPNGHAHAGHAINKILKDTINRSQNMLGQTAMFIPGWDCHGLPIESKVVQEWSESGKSATQDTAIEFRRDCRAFADHWVQEQIDDFRALGILGQWDAPYTTMSPESEAGILDVLYTFFEQGNLYRGERPIHWSVVEQTALADSEAIPTDHRSISVWVNFEIVSSSDADLDKARIVVWTTTPWSLPANQALAFNSGIEYGLYEVVSIEGQSRQKIGETYVFAATLLSELEEISKAKFKSIKVVTMESLQTLQAVHPLRENGFTHTASLLDGDFVEDTQGTGFVHLAPDHGVDDFHLCLKHDIHPLKILDHDTCYAGDTPLFSGKRVLDKNGQYTPVNGEIVSHLIAANTLFAKQSYRHKYPYSDRAKTPLIMRVTPQWFMDLEKNDLRHKSLQAIESVNWTTETAALRMKGMVTSRPDWCISRQRYWGVPIAFFINKQTGDILDDPVVRQAVIDKFRELGSDCWYELPPSAFLSDKYNPDEFEQVLDVLDVWFEAGSTHAFVLKNNESLPWPADLYVEGHDQYRGWFNASLFNSVALTGAAPYKAVLTHGFILDANGEKMSKSIGNVIAPSEIIQKYGVDAFRLWVLNVNYYEDMRLGDLSLKTAQKEYFLIRNTLRFLLGNLQGYTPVEPPQIEHFDDLEKWILSRLYELSRQINEAYTSYALRDVVSLIREFCAQDLSSFYFDIRKDRLYCDENSHKRQAVLYTLDHIFQCLVTWTAPVLCFTTDEAWQQRYGKSQASVHLQSFPSIPDTWKDLGILSTYDRIKKLRNEVYIKVDESVKSGAIKNAAHADVHIKTSENFGISDADMRDICLVSHLDITNDEALSPGQVNITIVASSNGKCQRCWQYSITNDKPLCDRCENYFERIK